jgi:monoamine oxidase
MERRVIVVGAGIAGLAAAWRIRQQAKLRQVDLDLAVLEASDEVGGKIASQRDGAWICETGPNGFLDNEPATLRLIDDLGLRDAPRSSTTSVPSSGLPVSRASRGCSAGRGASRSMNSDTSISSRRQRRPLKKPAGSSSAATAWPV